MTFLLIAYLIYTFVNPHFIDKKFKREAKILIMYYKICCIILFHRSMLKILSNYGQQNMVNTLIEYAQSQLNNKKYLFFTKSIRHQMSTLIKRTYFNHWQLSVSSAISYTFTVVSFLTLLKFTSVGFFEALISFLAAKKKNCFFLTY